MKKKSTYQCTVKDKHIGIPFHGLNFHIFHVGMAEENIRARSVLRYIFKSTVGWNTVGKNCRRNPRKMACSTGQSCYIPSHRFQRNFARLKDLPQN